MWECARVFVFCSFLRIGRDCGAECFEGRRKYISESGMTVCREVVQVTVRKLLDQNMSLAEGQGRSGQIITIIINKLGYAG